MNWFFLFPASTTVWFNSFVEKQYQQKQRHHNIQKLGITRLRQYKALASPASQSLATYQYHHAEKKLLQTHWTNPSVRMLSGTVLFSEQWSGMINHQCKCWYKWVLALSWMTRKKHTHIKHKREPSCQIATRFLGEKLFWQSDISTFINANSFKGFCMKNQPKHISFMPSFYSTRHQQ